MEKMIRHTTDWTHSTIASWLGVTIACLYYSQSSLDMGLQIPVHLALLCLLYFVIKRPNDHVQKVALSYFLLIVCLMQLTPTALIFIHLIMFTAIFSAHFSPLKMSLCVISILTSYSLSNYSRWAGDIPWVTLMVWTFFSIMNWFVSRKIIESLNIHYQSRQNYKELRATQSLMSAMSAEQERLNISRELHDTLGHKLTALSINLDFAKRQAEGKHAKNIALCHTLSQEVLEEVRLIVTKQRRQNNLLSAGLAQVLSATPQLKSTLIIAPELTHINEQASLCIIRFCQEMVSNALKHAQADSLYFEVSLSKSAIDPALHTDKVHQYITAKSFHNQPETRLPIARNGLTGLSERLELEHGQFKQYLNKKQLTSEICLPFSHLQPASSGLSS